MKFTDEEKQLLALRYYHDNHNVALLRAITQAMGLPNNWTGHTTASRELRTWRDEALMAADELIAMYSGPRGRLFRNEREAADLCKRLFTKMAGTPRQSDEYKRLREIKRKANRRQIRREFTLDLDIRRGPRGDQETPPGPPGQPD